MERLRCGYTTCGSLPVSLSCRRGHASKQAKACPPTHLFTSWLYTILEKNTCKYIAVRLCSSRNHAEQNLKIRTLRRCRLAAPLSFSLSLFVYLSYRHICTQLLYTCERVEENCHMWTSVSAMFGVVWWDALIDPILSFLLLPSPPLQTNPDGQICYQPDWFAHVRQVAVSWHLWW